MKLTRRHLRDLIIEIAKENKTMIPNRIKHNYLAVSHDEADQDRVREHGIPLGVIPPGYIVLDATFGSSLVTHDDVVALSGALTRLMLGPSMNINPQLPPFDEVPKIDLMRSLGITHIFFDMDHVAEATHRLDGVDQGEFIRSNSAVGTIHDGHLLDLDAFSEYHMNFPTGI